MASAHSLMSVTLVYLLFSLINISVLGSKEGPPAAKRPLSRLVRAPVCQDEFPNCKNYEKIMICTDAAAHKDWGFKYCKKYCGYCSTNTTPHPPKPTTPHPTRLKVCEDKVPNCAGYQPQIFCTDPSYRVWAEQHCSKYCHFCQVPTTMPHPPKKSTTTPQPPKKSTTTPQPPKKSTTLHPPKKTTPKPTPKPKPKKCINNIRNCKNYGKSVCAGRYHGWAKDNCPHFCGFCTTSCRDTISNCMSYDDSACTGKFTGWAKENCPAHCGYCD